MTALAAFDAAADFAGGGEHLGGSDRPGHGAPRRRTERRNCGDGCRGRGARSLAEPDHDAADRVPLAEVDMGLGDRSLPSPDALVAQLVVDRLRPVVDRGPETPASVGRYRTTLCGGRVGAVNLVVTGKPGGEPVAFVPVVVRHRCSGEADRKRGERRRNRPPWQSRCHFLPSIGLTRYLT